MWWNSCMDLLYPWKQVWSFRLEDWKSTETILLGIARNPNTNNIYNNDNTLILKVKVKSPFSTYFDINILFDSKFSHYITIFLPSISRSTDFLPFLWFEKPFILQTSVQTWLIYYRGRFWGKRTHENLISCVVRQ